jgi:hypothetical protein
MDTIFKTAEKWAEFGLSGVVISALFFVIWRLVTEAREHSEKLQEMHHRQTASLLREHREERAEWLESAERRDDKLGQAINNLTNSFHNLNRFKP